MSDITRFLTRLTAASCATAITAVSAWGFVHSSASAERDPLQVAALARSYDAFVRAARQASGKQASICWTESLSSGQRTGRLVPVCQRSAGSQAT